MLRSHRVVVLLLLLALVALSAGHAAAAGKGKRKTGQARITWSPERVAQTLAPGETASVDVTLTSSADLEQVSLRVPGGLGELLAVPSAPLRLKAGVPTTITLRLRMPAEGAHNQGGVVQVRMGPRTIPQPLHVKLSLPGAADETDD